MARLLGYWLTLLFFAAPAFADMNEYPTLFRGARETAMGGAMVGLADDEEALYTNPAGLAQIKKPVINLVPLMAETDLSLIEQMYSVIFAGAPDPYTTGLSTSSISQLQGQIFYARTQLAPSFVMPNFGVSFIVDQQVGLQFQNPAYPQANMLFQTTDGVQAGVGVPVYRSRGHRDEIDVGASAKILWRRGGYASLSDFALISQIGQNYGSIVNNVFGGFGTGYGADGGVLYTHIFRNKMILKVGASMTDIGNTSFNGGNAAPILSNTTFGASFKMNLGDFKFTAAYDYAHALDGNDWRLKNHLGLEAALSFLSLMVGINQVYPSYGLALDVWLLRITALVYTEETGEYAFQSPDTRALLEIKFKIPL